MQLGGRLDGDCLRPSPSREEEALKTTGADCLLEPNDVIQLDIEGDRARRIRLVGSAMPRLEAF